MFFGIYLDARKSSQPVLVKSCSTQKCTKTFPRNCYMMSKYKMTTVERLQDHFWPFCTGPKLMAHPVETFSRKYQGKNNIITQTMPVGLITAFSFRSQKVLLQRQNLFQCMALAKVIESLGMIQSESITIKKKYLGSNSVN